MSAHAPQAICSVPKQRSEIVSLQSCWINVQGDEESWRVEKFNLKWVLCISCVSIHASNIETYAGSIAQHLFYQLPSISILCMDTGMKRSGCLKLLGV